MADRVDRNRSSWPTPLGPRDQHAHPAMHTHALPATVRVMLGALVVAVLGLAVTVALVTGWVLTLRDQRLHAAREQQARINTTFCQVLAQLPANSPELDRIRHQLRCTEPGLSPDQMRALARTGGSP